MLLNRWNDIVARCGGQVAFWHPDAPGELSFGEIDRMAGEVDVSGESVIAVGESLEFFPALIAAWRAGKPALLLETRTSRVRPIATDIPAGTVLIKQTCGASGIERSLFFNAAQVVAEGRRNIEGLGLNKFGRSLAAISLAHSYGFGCLALPFLLEGIALEVIPGPLPMFVHAGLDRAGENRVFLPGVPAIWKTWWQSGVTGHPAIGLALCAGSPLSLELEAAIHADSGLKIHNFYGTSETGAIAFDDTAVPRRQPDFVGRPLPGIEMAVDAAQRLIVRSDSCALGADALAWDDEFGSPFYRAFDEGRVTDSGIEVSRCMGDAINVAGRKVSPARLRGILEQLEGVQAAEVGRGKSRDYERFEEIQVRLIVGPDYDKKILREQLRQRVESWEMPRHWEFEVV